MRNPFTIKALSISGVTWKWHFLNHALEEEVPDRAGGMIRQLAALRGIGVQSAIVLVREAFVREFANGKALGSTRA